MTETVVSIYIAGVYLDPLMENLDELEERFKGLELYAEIADRLEDSFDTMNAARAFWVTAEAEPKDRAAEDILAVWHGFDSAVQEIEFSDLNALAHTVRRCSHPSESATDSGLLAALALCYAVEGLRDIYDYQIELSQNLITSVPLELISEFPDLRQAQLQQARSRLMCREIDARVSHADCMGQARLAMFAAGIYLEAEALSRSSKGYRITDKIRSAMHLSRASKGGKNGTQITKANAAAAAKKACTLAKKILASRPMIANSELAALVAERENISCVTAINYLRQENLYPPKRRR